MVETTWKQLYLTPKKPYMSSPEIRTIQSRLGCRVDGVFGPELHRAV
jgi:hypothetical protein